MQNPQNESPEQQSDHSCKKIITFIVLLIITSTVVAALYNIPALRSTFTSPTNTRTPTKRSPDPEKYKKLITTIATQRETWQQAYKQGNAAQKTKILKEARAYLQEYMPHLMRCWIGTPWDFNGTSQTPGKGKIACGYFVSVILRDTGFKVSRISLAQQASQNIILTMIKNSDKKIIRYKQNYNTFISQFKQMPEGVYIIGLDTHVGYLLNLKGKVSFLHSGGSGVIEETAAQARDIKISKYRVIGNITLQDYVIKKWLQGTTIPTKK